MSTPSSAQATSTGRGKHSHQVKRLKSFALPDGREVYIAFSPEEAQSMMQRLEAIKEKDSFDLVINGSPEHIEALQRTYQYNEERRRILQEKYGEDVEAYDEFKRVRENLDALSVDLNVLTDHAVSANFSNYGYDAHLRTYDDPLESSRSTIPGHDNGDYRSMDLEEERRNGKVFKLYKKPIVQQYFHRGLLWRASQTVEVATCELFIDLLYVGIIAINGDRAAESPTGDELQRFAITFIMSWRIWYDIFVVISWFGLDDIVQRLSILFIMACLIGLTTNMLQAFEQTYSQLVAFYLAARFFIGSYYGFMSYAVPLVRGMMICQVIIIAMPSGIWIASIYVDMPNRLAMIWVALFLDVFGMKIVVFLIGKSHKISSRLAAWVADVFEFYPAVDIKHKIERTNAFVTLIFGYSVVALLYQNAASFGINAFLGKAVLGLIQAFCLNTIYFEIDGDSLFQHATKRNAISSLLWVSATLPFLLGFSLAGASLSKLIVAHDCDNADIEALTEVYKAKSSDTIDIGLRWFYCGGLGIALASMGIISLSHIHNEIGGLRIKKRHRLVNRFAVTIILFCLPLAHNLNSLYLISTTTGLIFWVMFVELYGASYPKESFFGERHACKYTALCKIARNDLELAVKNSNSVNLQDLSEKGLYELS